MKETAAPPPTAKLSNASDGPRPRTEMLRSRQVADLLLIDGVGEIAERLGHSRPVPRAQGEALIQYVARVRSGQPLIELPAAVEQTVSGQLHGPKDTSKATEVGPRAPKTMSRALSMSADIVFLAL
jgi:hypothetical protein